MSIAPDTARQTDWWYQKNGETCGPVSHEEIRELVDQGTVPPTTLVWSAAYSDEWQPFQASQHQPPSSSAEPADDPKWRPIFAKFDQTDGFTLQPSWPGFLFGPLYYCYLGLWRKGLLIIGVSICLSTALSLTFALFDAHLPPAFSFAANAFCGAFANYDFYRFKRFGGRMWAPLSMFQSPVAIGALYAAPVLVAAVVVYAGDLSPSPSAQASSSLPEASESAPDPETARIRAAATGQLKDSWYPGDARRAAAPSARATKACQEFLQDRYGQEYVNKYDEATKYTFKVNVYGGGLDRSSTYFGGHQFMIFNATAEKYLNGRLVTYLDVPDHVCVFTDDLQVIDAEISVRDGLR